MDANLAQIRIGASMSTRLVQNSRLTYQGDGEARTSKFVNWRGYHLETSENFWMVTTGNPANLRPDTVWTWNYDGSRILSYAQGNSQWVRGPVIPSAFISTSSNGGIPWTLPDGSSEDDLKAFGTKAIGLVAPNRSTVDLPVAIGEVIRDRLPHPPGEITFWKERALTARGAGSEYLNVEFGWKPLISDMQKTFKALTQMSRICKQYRDGGNVPQRRRYDSPQDIHETRVRTGSVTCLPANANLVMPGNSVETREMSTWFVGTFKYHVPTSDGFWDRMERYEAYANKLFGSRIDPETVWNLLPWSWAADWFGNIGDVARNAAALGQDGLVLTRGSVMQHRRLRILTTANVSGSKAEGSAVREYISESKIRRIASPYGFNVDWPDFTDRQIAIATALGLSRGGGRVAL